MTEATTPVTHEPYPLEDFFRAPAPTPEPPRNAPIIFEMAEERNREMVLTFIRDWAFKWHKCAPPQTRGPIMVAWQNDAVVGTLAYDFANERGQFPLARHYDFEAISDYFPVTASRVVQVSRWFASIRGISHQLLCESARRLLPIGFRFMLCEGKDHSIHQLEKLGFRYTTLYGLKPNLDAIPPEEHRYYEESPSPKLILIDLAHACTLFETCTQPKEEPHEMFVAA